MVESHSYCDKETKQPGSKRKRIGCIDDATGEIVPARKKAKVTATFSEHGDDITTQDAGTSVYLDIIKEKDAIITEQRRQISAPLKEKEYLTKERERLLAKLN